MQGKMAGSTTVRAARGHLSGPPLASVLQEGRKDANVFASSGVIWRILAYVVGFPCGSAVGIGIAL
jgi:hypothetical protein